MEAARERLNTKIGIRLYTPPHPAWTEKKGDLNVGGHSPGWAENGGIFCHANTWAVIAEALLGHGDQAWQYYRQIIPHVALQTAGLERYQAEPYAYVSVIAAPENIRFGATNVTQVTGTAAWMDVAATHYLLGIRAELAGLRIDPCIPHDWPGFTVTRNYRGCQVRITVDNPTSVQHGVAAMTVNGAAVDLSNGPVVPAGLLAGAGRPSADVAVRMGAKT
jgi:cellobiose phosphorylase